MIIPDINVLIYAYDSESPFHEQALTWWQNCLSGTEPVGLVPVVLFGFVRVSTSPRAFRHPMATTEATGHLRSWLGQPIAQMLTPSAQHVEQVVGLLDQIGTAGNLVTDAQIAAVAIEYDATVHTSDTDFVRFPGVRWLNPISGIGSRTLRKAP
ncbi:MAG: type II toxin-antitoxin system VapC family toxin [Vicinamibacterales bacterium]